MQRDESLEKLIYELQLLRGMNESIQQRINLVRSAIMELNMATSTLDGIGDKDAADSMLIPIGGGSYIRARIGDREKIIVGVGANVAVEKTVDEAKEDFQTRILELDKVRSSLQTQFDESITKADGLQREIRRLTQRARGDLPNVRGA
jgi:prefoldin alpha subunit